MGIVHVALADSTDVARSIGADGFLAKRLGAGRNDAPQLEVRHFPAARFDLMAQRLGSANAPDIDVPDGLAAWFGSNFSPSPLAQGPIMMVLSAAEVLRSVVFRHKAGGFLVSAPPSPAAEAHREWLDANFEPSPLGASEMTSALEEIARRSKEQEAEVVIYNVSTFVPAERPHWFPAGEPEPLSMIANRVDSILDSVAAKSGISVLDVDRIVAEYGAGEAVEAIGQYAAAALESIGEEAIALISELTGISTRFGAGVMRLVVPRQDRRTEGGVLVGWHVEAPCAIKQGDELFDLRFENIHSRLGEVHRRSNRAMSVTVVATRDGYLAETSVTEGSTVMAGATVGVVTDGPGTEAGDVDESATFPVGVKVLGRRDDDA